MAIQILGGLVAVGLLIWGLIAWAGSMGVMTLHKAHLKPLSEEAVRKILRRVLRQAPEVNAEWLKSEGFVALGVFRAEGLLGNPRIIVWENRGEATWFCGYLLPDGQIQLDVVSEMGPAGLTTGTSKDGHLFPTDEGKYIQTFDIDDMSDLWAHHQEAAGYLEANYGLRVDHRAPEFTEAFTSTLRQQGKFIRSIPLWSVRIPWWYFTRRGSRHNRSVEQLYG